MIGEGRSTTVKTTLTCESGRSMIITFFTISDRNHLPSPESQRRM
jgi:hypothetical protein